MGKRILLLMRMGRLAADGWFRFLEFEAGNRDFWDLWGKVEKSIVFKRVSMEKYIA